MFLALFNCETLAISNKITAISLLLDLEGSIIVTIDAIGTQTKIAKKIIENSADYIFTVKGNQKKLLEEIERRFKHFTIIEKLNASSLISL